MDEQGAEETREIVDLRLSADKGSKEYRARKVILLDIARKMVIVFAVVLIIGGGLRIFLSPGIQEEAEPSRLMSIFVGQSQGHCFLLAALSLLTGILYAVCAVGVYAGERWAFKLNVIAAVVYFVATGACLVFEATLPEGRLIESVARAFLRLVFPIIQLALLIIGARAAGTAPTPQE